MRLCATTVMFPRWTLDEIFDRLAEAEFEGVELRVRDNPPDPSTAPSYWGRHVADVSPTSVLERVPAIRAAAARTGLRVVALSPWLDPADLAGTSRMFEAALRIDPGAPPMVRVGPPTYDRNAPYQPQFDAARVSLGSAATRAREAGVKLLYEIHAGTVAMTATRARTLLDGMDPEAIGAIYDIPNMSRVGLEDPRQGLDALGPYLAHCHLGGSRPVPGAGPGGGGPEWSWEFCDARAGIANVPVLLSELSRAGYGGWISLEDFGPSTDEEKVRGEGGWLRELLATRAGSPAPRESGSLRAGDRGQAR